jgi:hypothetical protein
MNQQSTHLLPWLNFQEKATRLSLLFAPHGFVVFVIASLRFPVPLF